MTKLSKQQEELLDRARSLKPLTMKDGSVYEQGVFVQGPTYRTALALESKGLGTVSQLITPSRGFFRAHK